MRKYVFSQVVKENILYEWINQSVAQCIYDAGWTKQNRINQSINQSMSISDTWSI